MNTLEHLIQILGEEGAEISSQASKVNRFGLHENRDFPLTNLERLRLEFNDLLAVVDILNEHHGLAILRDEDRILAKRKKVEKYMLYSLELGTIQ